MPVSSENREKKFHLWGWLLFLVCACCFLAASIQSGNVLYFVGSLVFFIACIVFIVPLVIRKSDQD